MSLCGSQPLLQQAHVCRYHVSCKSNNLDDIIRNGSNDNVTARIHGKEASCRITLTEQRELVRARRGATVAENTQVYFTVV